MAHAVAVNKYNDNHVVIYFFKLITITSLLNCHIFFKLITITTLLSCDMRGYNLVSQNAVN